MRLPSVMGAQHSFSTVPSASIPRSSFDRSHGHKTTLDAGFLYPIFIDEVLPGDTMHLNMTGFARLSTPLKPIMDNMYMNTFFFFVPNRLLWSNWQKFNGEQDNPGDSTDFLVPQVDAGASGFAAGSMSDYFGLPLGVANLKVNAWWHRAYNRIYNEWFRDENLQTRAVQNMGDGPDLSTDYNLLRRGKRHDYFTSCLPWPQKGTSVTIPLGTSAPVSPVTPGTSYPTFKFGATNTLNLYGSTSVNTTGWANVDAVTNPGASVHPVWASSGLAADLSAATGATINQLRQAFQIQKMYERDARGGTRYTEIVRSHFGVISPDARLQRPEYLGGGQSPVLVHQVEQDTATGVTGSSTPQGNLAAFGTASMNGHGFSKSFTEHGVIIGLLSVRADLTYQQGLDRAFSRRTRFDFYWPSLAHIGEQAVLSQEIFCDGTAGDTSVFGYQERFGEYRYKPSRITGLFRSTATTPLDVWHLSQKFTTRPLLNSTFIGEAPPVARVVAVPSEPNFICDLWFNYRCARPMPVFGVPGLIDHF